MFANRRGVERTQDFTGNRVDTIQALAVVIAGPQGFAVPGQAARFLSYTTEGIQHFAGIGVELDEFVIRIAAS